jgi:twinkle protein
MALTNRLIEILEARGLDVELLVKHGVDASARHGSECIVIPFLEGGKVVNHKHRGFGEAKVFSQDTGGRQVFWNVDVISDPSLADRPLIITEGELDALAAIQCGFARTVSVPNGAPPLEVGEKDSARYQYLDNAPQALRDVREIIIAADGDAPGANLLHDLSLRLHRARCKWVKYPKDCKDLNDALRIYGPKGVTETIARAQWVRVDGVYRMSELPPLPDSTPYSIGLPVLDMRYRMRLGDFVVVTGIPNHGKSTWINELCCQMAMRHKWGAVFASFEQRPQSDHRRNLRTWFNRRLVKEQTLDQIKAADEWIERFFSFIVPSEDDDVTLDWTLEKCSAAIIRHNSKIVVIDPWNEMDHVRPPDMSLTEYTGFAIKEFRRLAKKHHVHVIVAAHPVKQKKLDNGEFAMPTLYDISDSAHWYNKCEVGMIVHRTSRDGTTIRVAKSRDHLEIGEPGDVPVMFNRETGRYEITDTDTGEVAA